MKQGKKQRAGIVILAAVIVLVGAGIFFYFWCLTEKKRWN